MQWFVPASSFLELWRAALPHWTGPTKMHSHSHTPHLHFFRANSSTGSSEFQAPLMQENARHGSQTMNSSLAPGPPSETRSVKVMPAKNSAGAVVERSSQETLLIGVGSWADGLKPEVER